VQRIYQIPLDAASEEDPERSFLNFHRHQHNGHNATKLSAETEMETWLEVKVNHILFVFFVLAHLFPCYSLLCTCDHSTDMQSKLAPSDKRQSSISAVQLPEAGPLVVRHCALTKGSELPLLEFNLRQLPGRIWKMAVETQEIDDITDNIFFTPAGDWWFLPSGNMTGAEAFVSQICTCGECIVPESGTVPRCPPTYSFTEGNQDFEIVCDLRTYMATRLAQRFCLRRRLRSEPVLAALEAHHLVKVVKELKPKA
jgi:hypothetical protein